MIDEPRLRDRLDETPRSNDSATLRAYSNRIGRQVAYERTYGESDGRVAIENGVWWEIMALAMSPRFKDTLADIEERWTFDQFHRARTADLLARAWEAFGG